MELNNSFHKGSDLFASAVSTLASLLYECIGETRNKSFLIAALGNPDITPDALGSLTASNILVTQHLKKHTPDDFRAFSCTSLCRTGVLGTTGIESAIQIKALCDTVKPDCVIAVDALAGADVSRLCSCIQISNTGIAPGSGVGNNREALDSSFLGVPVIAIGMPTVIDAGFFSDSEAVSSMFVTPRDIDSAVRNAGRLVGYGINLALHNGISISDVDMLLG